MSSLASVMENATALASKAETARLTETIYQIYPATFHDSNGDGIGDLRGIIERLDYIADLNVDAIWINPIYPSAPGPEGDGGYAVDDHRAIDPRFGTMADFEELLRQAHGRGLRVYLDFVLPHTSSRHEWYQASSDPAHPQHEQYKDFYVWHQGTVPPAAGSTCGCLVNCANCTPDPDSHTPPNNWLSVFGGSAWTWNPKLQKFGLAHFLRQQPALDLKNENVIEAVLADMKFWLDKGVDGLRLDSVPYANHDPEFRNNPWRHGHWDPARNGWEHQRFDHSMCQSQTVELIAKIRALADTYMQDPEYPRKITLIGEVIAGREGGNNPKDIAMGYVDPRHGLDSCYTTIERAIGLADPGFIRDMIREYGVSFPDGGLCFTVSDHDGFSKSPRAWSRLTDHLPEVLKNAAYRQALKIYATIPGTLSLYMGDELGLPHAGEEEIPDGQHKDPIRRTKGKEFCRDGARTPIPIRHVAKNAGFSNSENPYLPVPASHLLLAADMQEGDPDSTLHFVRSLMAWRRAQPALINGRTSMLDTKGDVLAFMRSNNEQTLVCFYNLGHQAIFMPLLPEMVANIDKKSLEKAGLSEGMTIMMRPYSSLFFGTRPTPHEPAPPIQSVPRVEQERVIT